MRIGKNTYILLATFVLFVSLWCGQASAITVAVFPVDDLSMLDNSVNVEMTQLLVDEIVKKGLETTSPETVISYMNVKNIRKLGYMETMDIMGTREAIGADLVVLASLCQNNIQSSSLGMTIQLVRTSDGKTIWANTTGITKSSEQRFLGIDAPNSLEELKTLLVSKLFVGWPDDLNFTAGRELAGAQIAAVKETTYLEVESVFFSPKVVRPGQKVKCTIRFKSQDSVASKAKVFVKVGSRVHLASSEDGTFFKAAWVGSGVKKVTDVNLAVNSNDTNILSQVWNGDVVDADYPVSLILDWPSGKRDESYLGSYVVDSRPPELFFKLGGKVIDGQLTFRKELPISVRFKRNEPIKKWEFKVTDSKGKTILRDRGSSLPPDFVWRGQNEKNIRAESGMYSITLKVWDLAGNVSHASEKVRLLKSKPKVAISLKKYETKGVVAQLVSSENIAVNSWRMELWSGNNQLLKTYKGKSLPVAFKLPIFDDSIDQENIACVLSVRDGLGGKSIEKTPKIFTQILDTSINDQSHEESPIEPNEWHADF